MGSSCRRTNATRQARANRRRKSFSRRSSIASLFPGASVDFLFASPMGNIRRLGISGKFAKPDGRSTSAIAEPQNRKATASCVPECSYRRSLRVRQASETSFFSAEGDKSNENLLEFCAFNRGGKKDRCHEPMVQPFIFEIKCESA